MNTNTIPEHSTLSPVQSPLLLSEILEHLFDLFNPNTSEFAELRLVSRAWNEEICRILRYKRQIKIHSLDNLEKCQAFHFENPNFSQLIPFHNYKFVGRYWSIFYLSTESTISEFLAHNLKILQLEINGWNLWNFETFFREFDLPNLQQLTLKCPNEIELYRGLTLVPSSQPIQLTTLTHLEVHRLKTLMIPLICALIQQNVHLRRFVIKEVDRRISKCLPTSLLPTLRETIHNLSQLNLDYYLTNTQLNSLLQNQNPRQRQLQLKTLSFGVQANFKIETLAELLNSVKSTLISLELTFEWIIDKINLNLLLHSLPCMRKLTNFAATNIKSSLDFFIKFCPNVQVLSLNNFEGIPTLALPFVQLNHVQTLSIRYPSHNSTNNCMEDLCYIFPNVKHLCLQGELSNSNVQLILAKLERLVVLKLVAQKTYFDDGCFMGNHERELDLSGNGSSSTCIWNEIDADDDEFGEFQQVIHQAEGVRRKCICQLEDLRDLHIEMNPKISDAIFNSIGHCKRLRRLTLKGPRLTDSLLTSLVNNLPLDQLTFHGGLIHRASKASAEKILRSSSYCDIKEMEAANHMQLFQSIVDTLDRGRILPTAGCSIT